MPEDGQTGKPHAEDATPEPRRYVVDYRKAPPNHPTHMHAPAFWEGLGRVVATFGFLEEALGKDQPVSETRCHR
jgi:hypothetical protein